MLVNLKEILKNAEEGGYAVGCINTPNMATLRAVVDAAEEMQTPIIIDHAQVHDPLIPIELIGPEIVRNIAESRQKFRYVFTWTTEAIIILLCGHCAADSVRSCMI